VPSKEISKTISLGKTKAHECNPCFNYSGRDKPGFFLLSEHPFWHGCSLLSHPPTGIHFFIKAYLQLAYTFSLKHIIILDVFSIAAGFVLRVLAGAVVIDIPVSTWLLVCTMLLALFLSFCKRRHELVNLEEEAVNHRKSLKEYSPYLLDQMIAVVTASTLISYALYTMSAETVQKFGTTNLKYTIPLVLFGIFRYLYLIHQKDGGGNPESVILKDKPMTLNVTIYVLIIVLILYW